MVIDFLKIKLHRYSILKFQCVFLKNVGKKLTFEVIVSPQQINNHQKKKTSERINQSNDTTSKFNQVFI